MPRTPFPHILEEPKFSNKHTLRFVTDEPVGELLFMHSHIQENMKTREFEAAYQVYRVLNISESRPARGDWSAYDQWPTYYESQGEAIGLRFKSAIDEPISNE